MRKTIKTIFLSLFFLTFMASQSGLAVAQATNLAAGKTYNSNPAANEPYGDNGTKLTDQQIAQLIPTDNGWVGYGFGEPTISFILDIPAELTQIRAHFLDLPSWGINYPQSVEVQTSADGTVWNSQGNLQLQGEYFELALPQTHAKYVRLLINRLYWTFISEIEIYGETVAPSSDPLKNVLFLTSTQDNNNESYNRMINTLDGLGFAYDIADDSQIITTDLNNYQLVIVDGTSFELLDINLTEEQNIVASIEQGVNYLWIGAGIWGSFQTTNLPNAFGLEYLSEGTSAQFNVTEAEFVDLAGNLTKFPVYNEYIRKVNPIQAIVEGSYYSGATKQTFPLITKYQTPSGAQTVYISLPMLDFWKSTEAEYTYARTELLTKYIRQLTTKGYVGLHPAKFGKESTFLVRLEDYTPGGTFIDHSTKSWMDRMKEFLEFTIANYLPMNIALVPIYAHPFLGELFTWSDTVNEIPKLKDFAQKAKDAGGSLIVHGYKHQNGSAEDDYSGDDWEMWDEDTGLYLSLAQQQKITNDAITEAGAQFSYTPTIWETPHYISDANTYLAAANSGFIFFTESDTKLFPNQRGYLNKSNGNLWNIPETAFDFPEDDASITALEPIKKDHILPRLARLNAPYYIFYHNNLDAQLNSLSNILAKAQTYNMWYPSMEEFGNFWLTRNQASISTAHDSQLQKISTAVSNSFEGLTLAVRLPNNMKPNQVLVNGAPVAASEKRVDGIWYVYPSMPAGTSATVQILYSSYSADDVSASYVDSLDLIAHWELNESSGTVAVDSSNNSSDGDVHGADWVPGKLQGALSFDGINDTVFIKKPKESDFGKKDNFTFAAWVHVNSCQTNGSKFIEKKQKDKESIQLECENNLSLFSVRDNKKNKVEVKGTTLLEGTGWHHLAGVRAGNEVRLYVDGKLEGSKPAEFKGDWKKGDMRIGDSIDGGARKVDGLIDDVRIYRRALTPDEIATLAL